MVHLDVVDGDAGVVEGADDGGGEAGAAARPVRAGAGRRRSTDTAPATSGGERGGGAGVGRGEGDLELLAADARP